MHELRIHRAGALLHRTERREEHRKIRGAEICTDPTLALGANDQLLDQRDELRTDAQQARLVLRAAVEMVQDQLEDAQPDLFDITTGEDRDAAVEAIEQRDVYGAIVIGRPAEVISASANNAATGQILQRVGEQLGEQTGMPVTQTDLIPFSENDPNGAGLGVLAFPMVMGGLAGGIVIGQYLPPGRSPR
ncbi:putative membrane protein [Kocuria palustris PEL]|uniref:Membrane protein n=1 Tax=Kocuria palustris PEL TaxID=1236550 RepID=M2YCC0_9MICC|nr:putative membrane protein [Kocuria palustris PEL]